MENIRNFYRILNVQPDAPAEIIRACYITLLRELKKHPDLGGDRFDAALINEAYETLSNSRKRAEYDTVLRESNMSKGLSGRTIDIKHMKEASPVMPPYSGQMLIRKPVPACHGNIYVHAEKVTKGNDRRVVHRIKKNGKIHYGVSFLQTDQEAEIQDLSPQGICFISSYKIMTKRTVKIKSPFFKALARIIHSETGQLNGQNFYSIGARFLSVTFRNLKGSFYSRVIDEACV